MMGDYKFKATFGKAGVFILAAIFSIVLSFSSTAIAQNENSWAKCYGGRRGDFGFSIQQTKDGGYIVAGYTDSFGAGGGDFWVLKLDQAGGVIWQKCYGGTKGDVASSIQQTKDGGYVVAGWTYSFGAGKGDFWVLKLDQAGGVIWQKCYGGTNWDEATSIQQTKDGGYVVAGWTDSFGAGWEDLWVLKLDRAGKIVWQKCYGGTKGDFTYSIQQTKDGGYVVAGWTHSFGAGKGDLWVLKLNQAGEIIWQKCYGGTKEDWAHSIQQTKDGGYVVAGTTYSFVAGESDFWVLKLDRTGKVIWQKCYGGTWMDDAYSIQQTKDGGYVVAGRTYSFVAGESDFWVLKLDQAGEVIWQKCYGGTRMDDADSIQQTKDGGYVVAGKTDSFWAGEGDLWVLKLSPEGLCPGMGSDTNATVQASSATVKDTNAIPITTQAVVTATNAVGVVTNAVVQTQSTTGQVKPK